MGGLLNWLGCSNSKPHHRQLGDSVRWALQCKCLLPGWAFLWWRIIIGINFSQRIWLWCQWQSALGRSLLHKACHVGNFDLARTLRHEYSVDINTKDGNSDTPMHVAAKLTLFLINEFYCDARIRGASSRSLLYKASQGGNINLIRTFILDYDVLRIA